LHAITLQPIGLVLLAVHFAATAAASDFLQPQRIFKLLNHPLHLRQFDERRNASLRCRQYSVPQLIFLILLLVTRDGCAQNFICKTIVWGALLGCLRNDFLSLKVVKNIE